ncbi:MAG: hypothetical protein HRT44_04415 [Bdellovibrionales bacterium]|nr:hypothetical protein [Bdellovibrionales bacterium]NQZ18487.1 hypothetical protein [Bdellovibrionales bacterium]
MCKNLLLIISAILVTVSVDARTCSEVFASRSTQTTGHEVLFEQIESMLDMAQSLQLFARTQRGRDKEVEHIRSDLEGIKRHLASRISRQNYALEYLQKWESFNAFWLKKAQEFQQLPPARQAQLKEYMELPISFSLKHFISFFEASHHMKWKFERLDTFLDIHTKHPNVSVETALFLFNRQVLKFYSRWDFLRCKY